MLRLIGSSALHGASRARRSEACRLRNSNTQGLENRYSIDIVTHVRINPRYDEVLPKQDALTWRERRARTSDDKSNALGAISEPLGVHLRRVRGGVWGVLELFFIDSGLRDDELS